MDFITVSEESDKDTKSYVYFCYCLHGKEKMSRREMKKLSKRWKITNKPFSIYLGIS